MKELEPESPDCCVCGVTFGPGARYSFTNSLTNPKTWCPKCIMAADEQDFANSQEAFRPYVGGPTTTKSDPAYVILCREVEVSPEVSAYELKNLGQVPQAVLKHMAGVAKHQGFQLMFEFGAEPNMAEIQAACESGAGISSIESMAQLWVLAPEDLEE